MLMIMHKDAKMLMMRANERTHQICLSHLISQRHTLTKSQVDYPLHMQPCVRPGTQQNEMSLCVHVCIASVYVMLKNRCPH